MQTGKFSLKTKQNSKHLFSTHCIPTKGFAGRLRPQGESGHICWPFYAIVFKTLETTDVFLPASRTHRPCNKDSRVRVGRGLQLSTPWPRPWDAGGCPASDPYPPLLQVAGLSGHISRKWGQHPRGSSTSQPCVIPPSPSWAGPHLIPPATPHQTSTSQPTSSPHLGCFLALLKLGSHHPCAKKAPT